MTAANASVVEVSADSSASASGTGLGQGQKGGWSQNKSERQDLLKRRRDEMILEARRKMEERDRMKAVGQ